MGFLALTRVTAAADRVGLLRACVAGTSPIPSPRSWNVGFIIDDVEPSPAADSAHDRVDLYGYTTMVVAALKAQARQLEALKREVEQLRRDARGRDTRAPRSDPAP